MRLKLAIICSTVAIAFGGGVAVDAPPAGAHTWYCGHGTLYTSPGAQRERFGGHYANGDHHVTTQRYTPSGSYWWIVDSHRRICE